jgi:hypothetical protein
MGSAEPSPSRSSSQPVERSSSRRLRALLRAGLPSHQRARLISRRGEANAYLPEKRKALDAWAALLRNIVSDEPRASNVVALKGQQ